MLIAGILTPLLFAPNESFGWYEHKYLLPWIISDEGLTSGDGALSPEEKRTLTTAFNPQCGSEENVNLRSQVNVLQLNQQARYAATASDACAQNRQTSGAEILRGPFVDEPDQGMDDDLLDDADPDGEREFLGGKSGPASKTFRHVFYAGWSLMHPILTYQSPINAIGKAHRRVEILAQNAKTFFTTNKTLSYRLLAWAFHYIQDLSQPFHAVQTPSTEMVPWYALWTWPPSKAFSDISRETARSVTNYHWAVEGYVRDRMLQSAENNPFTDCLSNSAFYVTIQERGGIKMPIDLARAVAQASVRGAAILGPATVAFFGHDLTLRDRDFTKGQPQPNYGELAVRPDLLEKRKAFQDAACRSLANGAWATRWLIRWLVAS